LFALLFVSVKAQTPTGKSCSAADTKSPANTAPADYDDDRWTDDDGETSDHGFSRLNLKQKVFPILPSTNPQMSAQFFNRQSILLPLFPYSTESPKKV